MPNKRVKFGVVTVIQLSQTVNVIIAIGAISNILGTIATNWVDMIEVTRLHSFVLREAQQTRHDQSQIHHSAKHLNR